MNIIIKKPYAFLMALSLVLSVGSTHRTQAMDEKPQDLSLKEEHIENSARKNIEQWDCHARTISYLKSQKVEFLEQKEDQLSKQETDKIKEINKFSDLLHQRKVAWSTQEFESIKIICNQKNKIQAELFQTRLALKCKKGCLAPKKTQEFIQQCYKVMNQFNQDYSDLPRKKIDKFINKNNALQVYIESNNGGINMGNAIFVDSNFWKNNTDENLTPIQKFILTHECAHAWFGHVIKEEFTTTKKRSYIQADFETNTLTMRTLYAMNEQVAITEGLISSPNFITENHNKNTYIMGGINGITYLKTTETYKKIIDSLKKKLATYTHDDKNTLMIKHIQFILKYSENWQPTKTYVDAIQMKKQYDEQQRLQDLRNSLTELTEDERCKLTNLLSEQDNAY